MRLVRASSRVLRPVVRPCTSSRVRISIAISSSEQLPARSPIPLTAHST